MPAPLAALHPGEIHGIGVLVGLCARCNQTHGRLPHGTRQKRLNAAAERAASDTSDTYWSARFPDPDAAELAARLLGNAVTAPDTLTALGWQ